MTTLFIAAGPIEWGSSRMRAFWPAQYMDSEVLTWQQWQERRDEPVQHDAYVFQKRIDGAAASHLHQSGIPVWWDACDPAWWWEPDTVRGIVQNVTGVVCSSDELLADFLDWMEHDGPPLDGELQAHMIPDRIEPRHFQKVRSHKDISPVRFVWYGIAVNRIAIYAALANLERLAANGHDIELTIFDERPDALFKVTDKFPVYHTEWTLKSENHVLASHDIALIPPYPGPWGRVKSNNRKVTAAACGLPFTDAQDYWDLEKLATDASVRKELAWYGTEWVKSDKDVRQSASEWEELLAQ